MPRANPDDGQEADVARESSNGPARESGFGALIAEVAAQEMQMIGVDAEQADIPTTALYTESVRRVQCWTFEWLAKQRPDGDAMRDMFLDMARGVNRVDEVELWTGRAA